LSFWSVEALAGGCEGVGIEGGEDPSRWFGDWTGHDEGDVVDGFACGENGVGGEVLVPEVYIGHPGCNHVRLVNTHGRWVYIPEVLHLEQV
jgi:hypothetical protein